MFTQLMVTVIALAVGFLACAIIVMHDDDPMA